jgi:hypothetical protein
MPNLIFTTEFINIIRLPKTSDATNTFNGTSAIITGWGLTADGLYYIQINQF